MMKFSHNLYVNSCVFDCKAKPLYEWGKRFFDLVFSVLLLILLFPVMILIGLAVFLESGFPVIYKQERLGRFGTPFVMLKFRTMKKEAERDGPVWAARKDARCTRTGAFLRRFHLDELPQLWNILRGEMSFVGPRPERAVFYEAFHETVDGFERRLCVKPGLTGLAQINGGYDLTPAEKFRLDADYMARRSLSFDFYCVFRTFPAVLGGRGVR